MGLSGGGVKSRALYITIIETVSKFFIKIQAIIQILYRYYINLIKLSQSVRRQYPRFRGFRV